MVMFYPRAKRKNHFTPQPQNIYRKSPSTNGNLLHLGNRTEISNNPHGIINTITCSVNEFHGKKIKGKPFMPKPN